VFFERDGEGCFFRDALEDFDIFDVEFKAAGGACVGTDRAGYDYARFLREVLDGFEDGFGDGGFGDDALDGPGAIAKDGEEEFAAGTQVIEPGVEGDALAFVPAESGYGGEWCGGVQCF
jgi:hypothetical protein